MTKDMALIICNCYYHHTIVKYVKAKAVIDIGRPVCSVITPEILNQMKHSTKCHTGSRHSAKHDKFLNAATIITIQPGMNGLAIKYQSLVMVNRKGSKHATARPCQAKVMVALHSYWWATLY